MKMFPPGYALAGLLLLAAASVVQAGGGHCAGCSGTPAAGGAGGCNCGHTAPAVRATTALHCGCQCGHIAAGCSGAGCGLAHIGAACGSAHGGYPGYGQSGHPTAGFLSGYEGLPNMDGGGVHHRYPYHSYRRPWFHPGPPSANVTIVW